MFGIGITHLTSLLARRSVYCSKHANGKHSIAKSFASDDGNIWFKRTEHTWVDGKCKYCGASQNTFDRGEGLETHAYAFIHTDDIKTRIAELFGGDMQFDVIIGNPPYQLDDGGFGTSAAPIYQLFVEQAKKLEPRYLSMVIPARWFAGGKGLDEFRESMLTDNRCAPLTTISAHRTSSQGWASRAAFVISSGTGTIPGPAESPPISRTGLSRPPARPLLEEGVDVFIRFNEGLSILKKVVAVESGKSRSLSLPENKRFDRLVSSRKPFGLETTFKGKVAKRAGDVLVYQNGGTGYIARSSISTGADLIDKWKLFAGYAAPGTGNKDTYPHRIISTPFVGEPGTHLFGDLSLHRPVRFEESG